MDAGRPKGDASDPPAWLFRFDYAAWLPGCSPERPDPDQSGWFTGDPEVWLAAKERWHAAARDWLAGRGLYMERHRQPDSRVREWCEFKRANPNLVIDGRDALRGIWRAQQDSLRIRMGWRPPSDQGGRKTAGEADFPVYGSGAFSIGEDV
ncbi:hypothetical protein Nocox_36915 [Nonomuraea coxensis DSM 45129]|uniref:Uncharacterized protein n=2 Tax=Nonomuraea coxensis TaxID=404386 RepID=A0ABX8UE44_9ACTN|nr:hypothetical protein Nocox_36915 [Nonomuraea coxensis DSM 45129]